MKHLAVIAFALAIGGCANHANFEQPDSYKVIGDQFNQQTLYYEVRYSQPYPGVFNGNEQQPMDPLMILNCRWCQENRWPIPKA